MSYSLAGRRRFLAVHGGFLEVIEDRVRVLADLAERGEEIDLSRARADLEKAEAELSNPAPGTDPAEALAAMARARARISAAEQR